MSIRFRKNRGLIVVATEIVGPTGSAVLRLALDTGATITLLNTGMLVALGYDPIATSDRVEMTTGSGVEFASRITVS